MNSFNRVYIHFVWATWDRKPVIEKEWESRLNEGIAGACRELNGQPVEIGGTADHVHVLVRFPATKTIAEMAKKMKGSSSHLVNHVLKPGDHFQWQGAYGGLSVSPQDVARIRAYIRRQKEHHVNGHLITELEQVFDEEEDFSL
jgi:putative transposase